MSHQYPDKTCQICFEKFPHRHAPKAVNLFCSKKCEGQHKRNNTYKRFLEGTVKDRGTVRKILLEQKPECWDCGTKEWRGKMLSLEVDHIDGNAGNHIPSNVRLLCPNCHSITPNYKAKNKGNGRAARGLPLY
jgi:5-methylcytosine-specific restriction endonuclease McrA